MSAHDPKKPRNPGYWPKVYTKVINNEDTQAGRIVGKFGGVKRFLEIAQAVGYKLNKSTVHRWAYPKERGGLNGVIPHAHWEMITKMAALDGLFLKSVDFDPRPRPIEETAMELRPPNAPAGQGKRHKKYKKPHVIGT